MAKKGTFNGSFFSNFASRLHGTPVRFGLLLGQQVEGGLGDVVFAAPTPAQLGEDGEPAAVPKDTAALLRSSTGGVAFAEWAVQHAEAVRKLLPAGLEPLGCFTVASEASAKDLAPLLAPILRGFSEPLVLSIDPSTRKNTFWQLAVCAKPALRPAQMKADSYKEFLLLWTVTNIDVMVPQYSDDGIEKVAMEVSRAVTESLKSSIATIASDGGVAQVVDWKSESSLASAAAKDCQQLRVAFLRRGDSPFGQGSVRQRCVMAASALLLRRNGELREAVAKLREESWRPPRQSVCVWPWKSASSQASC
ncbi:unnamed protein product [Effrenium voratum]|nr:unnamed protein product [Effrenium voratum]